MMEIGREVKPVEFINTDVWGIEHALRQTVRKHVFYFILLDFYVLH